MSLVLLTGATSGIGLAIGKQLAAEGYTVFGIGRSADKAERLANELPRNFHLAACDITDTSALSAVLKQFRAQSDGAYPDIVIHSAGVGYYGLTENISSDQISALIRTNLEAPLLLTAHLLPPMKQRSSGHFIFLSSVTATQVNPHGAVYGATKAALSSFAKSLFAEVRKNGIKVTVIAPDMTDTALYRNADFCADSDACLFPEDIADAVVSALSAGNHVNVSEITVQPQLHRIQRKP